MNDAGPIYVAIGANLPGWNKSSPLSGCAAGVEALRGLSGLRLAGMSRWYATRSIPPGAPDYVNGVAWLEGRVDPAWLLARLHAIEAAGGRLRGLVDASRTLDLDIVAIGGLLREAPDPVLPHPRAHLRRFVLEPLRELAPHWVHPRLGLTCAQLLENLPDQGVRLL